jgi:hypothetical protein
MAHAPLTVPSQREARRAQSLAANRRRRRHPQAERPSTRHPTSAPPPSSRVATGKAPRDATTLMHESGHRAVTTSVATQPDEEDNHHCQTGEPRPRDSDPNARGRELRRKAPPLPS